MIPLGPALLMTFHQHRNTQSGWGSALHLTAVPKFVIWKLNHFHQRRSQDVRQDNSKIITLNLAPIGTTTRGASTSSVLVIFPVRPTGSLLTSYMAQLKGAYQTCTADASHPQPSCEVTGLPLSGTGYTIQARSSAPGTGGSIQSDPLELSGFTLPDGILVI